MGFHENINLAATHRRQTPLMNDGVAKNRIRGSVDGAMMMSETGRQMVVTAVVGKHQNDPVAVYGYAPNPTQL